MIQGKWFPQGSELTAPLAIRQAVFSRGQDARDSLAQQVVVYQDGVPAGSARLWWEEGAFHLGDVGVLEAERGKGLGDLLVRLLLFKAVSHYASQVELETPPETAPFFARYGFAPGQAAANSPTIPMSIRGEDIALSHCGAEHCSNCCETCGQQG